MVPFVQLDHSANEIADLALRPLIGFPNESRRCLARGHLTLSTSHGAPFWIFLWIFSFADVLGVLKLSPSHRANRIALFRRWLLVVWAVRARYWLIGAPQPVCESRASHAGMNDRIWIRCKVVQRYDIFRSGPIRFSFWWHGAWWGSICTHNQNCSRKRGHVNKKCFQKEILPEKLGIAGLSSQR